MGTGIETGTTKPASICYEMAVYAAEKYGITRAGNGGQSMCLTSVRRSGKDRDK